MEPGTKIGIAVGLGLAALTGAAWWLSTREERLRGGTADGLRPEYFNPFELARGTQHELEHTDDPAVAREIAMDHLAEDPRYYDKLEAASP